MATATMSPEAHHDVLRATSPRPRNGERCRPRLLRACATEPSITTSNACKGLLTNPNASRKATDLLSRVATSTTSLSPASTRSSLESGERRDYRLSEGSQYSACYFSFPSFDTWEEQRSEEKARERGT
ncbi:hypothetical protein F5X99DRAFT_221532 [Biscogniauxia marginata]|nr:hypothetical protein F5X99DRAFT_221532 [Biscogniauxia marginata]